MTRSQSYFSRLLFYICGSPTLLQKMRAVSMHLKMTGTRHVVNFKNHGNYDKKTGLREPNSPESNLNLSDY
jgi:hypothetical protein